MGKVMGLFMQGFSDEEIMQQTGIDEETLSIIKERQGRMMDRAREMSAMYGGSLPQQFATPGAPPAAIAPGMTTPAVTTPGIPMPPSPVMVKKKSKVRVFFRKKQVVIFLIGLAFAAVAATIMGILCMPYTAFWWLIILEMIGVNILFQIVLGIVAFRATFSSRTYKAAAYADYDGDGKYDEAAFASKTVSGTSVKLRALAITFLIFLGLSVSVIFQFGISVQGIFEQTDISLGGDVIAAFFVIHSLGALIGGWGLTRG